MNILLTVLDLIELELVHLLLCFTEVEQVEEGAACRGWSARCPRGQSGAASDSWGGWWKNSQQESVKVPKLLEFKKSW